MSLDRNTIRPHILHFTRRDTINGTGKLLLIMNCLVLHFSFTATKKKNMDGMSNDHRTGAFA